MPDALLHAAPTPDLVNVPARTVLALAGEGAPEGESFQRAIGALYGIAYTLKFARKPHGGDFRIGPLEGRWWAGRGKPLVEAARDRWRWDLRIAVPDDVDEEELDQTVETVTTKRRGKLEGSPDARRVRLVHLPEERYARALHVGPYADEGATFARMVKLLETAREAPAGPHLEVYLGDPRHARPEKLKTALLLELRPPRARRSRALLAPRAQALPGAAP